MCGHRTGHWYILVTYEGCTAPAHGAPLDMVAGLPPSGLGQETVSGLQSHSDRHGEWWQPPPRPTTSLGHCQGAGSNPRGSRNYGTLSSLTYLGEISSWSRKSPFFANGPRLLKLRSQKPCHLNGGGGRGNSLFCSCALSTVSLDMLLLKMLPPFILRAQKPDHLA